MNLKIFLFNIKKINDKKVLPKPEINKLIQQFRNRKNFLNENNIATTKYVTIRDERIYVKI